MSPWCRGCGCRYYTSHVGSCSLVHGDSKLNVRGTTFTQQENPHDILFVENDEFVWETDALNEYFELCWSEPNTGVFRTIKGACIAKDDCVESSHYPSFAHEQETCSIVSDDEGYLDVREWTLSPADSFFLNGTDVRTTLADAHIFIGSEIEWTAGTQGRWKVCLRHRNHHAEIIAIILATLIVIGGIIGIMILVASMILMKGIFR